MAVHHKSSLKQESIVEDEIRKEIHHFVFHEVPKGMIRDPDNRILELYKAKTRSWCNRMTGKEKALAILRSAQDCADVNQVIQLLCNVEMKNAGLGVIRV
jgi:hypothetical protein